MTRVRSCSVALIAINNWHGQYDELKRSLVELVQVRAFSHAFLVVVVCRGGWVGMGGRGLPVEGLAQEVGYIIVIAQVAMDLWQ